MGSEMCIRDRRSTVRRLHNGRRTLALSLLPPLSFSVRSFFRRLWRLFLHGRLWSLSGTSTSTVLCGTLILGTLRLACFSNCGLARLFLRSVAFFGILRRRARVAAAVFHRRACYRRRSTSLPLSLFSHTRQICRRTSSVSGLNFNHM